jgi:hypothetical protein
MTIAKSKSSRLIYNLVVGVPLGKVNLISRLSSWITKKYGAGGRILFYNLYFAKENY